MGKRSREGKNDTDVKQCEIKDALLLDENVKSDIADDCSQHSKHKKKKKSVSGHSSSDTREICKLNGKEANKQSVSSNSSDKDKDHIEYTEIPNTSNKRKKIRKEKNKLAVTVSDSKSVDNCDSTSEIHKDDVEAKSVKKRKKIKENNNFESTNETKENSSTDNQDDNTETRNNDASDNVTNEIIKNKKEKKKGKKKDCNEKEVGVDVKQGPGADQLAIDYLRQWEKNKEQWKFQKVRQVWLLQNAYNKDKIEDSDFKTLLLYLDGLKGKSREITAKEAESIIVANEDETKDVSEERLLRAKQITQVLI